MKTVEAIKAAKKRGALHFAALEGQTEICYYLLEDLKLQIDSKDDDVDTALIHAAWRGHTATAKYFIDHGADPTIACIFFLIFVLAMFCDKTNLLAQCARWTCLVWIDWFELNYRHRHL
ncbi:unnamed protein product [Vicia faba]|uniref:Uncharacterized protein n=1 Tax=Vicia faba TaxID=3906 RepID=A0AAV1AYL4_VICFA|nr:unnamed protein product [Vicia faba]